MGQMVDRKNKRTEGSSLDKILLLDHQLCFALYATTHSMTKTYQPILKRIGLTYPQYIVLMVLWEQDGLTVSQLGARLELDSGTLTPLLKRMETSGWLVRKRAVEDERQVLISLTAEGRGLRKKALAVPEKIKAASQCSISEMAELARKLNQLRKSLNERVES